MQSDGDLMKSDGCRICISVVSHGQGALVGRLLEDLEHCGLPKLEVVLTINIPEDESFVGSRPYPIKVIRNEQPKGFGANHNSASKVTDAPLFAVVNPDVRVKPQDWEPFLSRLASDARVAACAPKVVNPQGDIEDHARSFPTLTSLLARKLGRHKESLRYSADAPFEPDWVAGMFVVFKASAFRRVGGFDSRRFFMYFEDVDICRRLRAEGWTIRVNPAVTVIHDARRASRRDLRHLKWHLSSAFRYLSGL